MRSLALALCLVLGTPAHAALRVVATTSDAASLVEIVGGDRVRVKTIAQGYQDPHYLEAKPSFVVDLRRADLLVYIGLELEVGWLPLLLDGARNPRLREGSPGLLALDVGLQILEVPAGEPSRAAGDVHPHGNPHYWLDPRNQLTMAATVCARLSALDPEGAAGFEARREDFERRLRGAITGWEDRLRPLRGVEVISYHKQWEYLFAWAEIGIAGYVEAKAGIPPAPRHVQEVEATMRARRIGSIVIANSFEPAQAERLAARAGASVLVLPASVGAEEGLDDPFTLFESIVRRLLEGLRREERP